MTNQEKKIVGLTAFYVKYRAMGLVDTTSAYQRTRSVRNFLTSTGLFEFIVQYFT